MDYEKAYKDALNRAKHALDCHNQGMVSTDVSLITSMFPELKEPEDEKVRKALIEMVHDTPNSECEQNYNVRKEDCLTWLEKQGEQKPSTIDIDKMVDDYANNKERGNEEFGKPKMSESTSSVAVF